MSYFHITITGSPVSKAEQDSCSSSIWVWNANLSSTADQPKLVYNCYHCLSFSSDYFLEHKADRIAAQVNRRFADGGIEMMKKGMQLNSILKYAEFSDPFLCLTSILM